MSQNSAFVVIPFQRVGTRIGASRVFVFDDPTPAKLTARRLSAQVAGVALVERRFDENTGDDVDTLIEALGAVPPDITGSIDWTMRLH
jgi:hypothetical protein